MAELPPNEKAMAPQLATNPRGEEVPLQLATKREGPTAAADNDRFITRDVIIQRAETWTDHPVPYSMDDYKDGYRTDCSGYVSMAWNLNLSQTTWTLVDVCTRNPISKDHLQPGDVLIKNNPADRQFGSHVVIFAGWVDADHTAYRAYEQTPPQTRFDDDAAPVPSILWRRRRPPTLPL